MLKSNFVDSDTAPKFACDFENQVIFAQGDKKGNISALTLYI